MARKAKAVDEEITGGKATNGFDAEKVGPYVDRIENLQDEIDGIMLEAREKCEPLRADIAGIKKDSREEDSIPARELNSVIRKRRLLRKADGVRESLSEEQQQNFDDMEKALGMLADTPLGGAALKGKKKLTDEERALAH